MSPPIEEIQKTLNSLHQQLASLEKLDPSTETLMKEVVRDIDQVLQARAGTGQTASAEQGTLLDRLREAATLFEEQHPILSGTLKNLVDLLGRMGI